MLEFKPKTPLPDVYSLPFLKSFAKTNSLHVDDLIQILKNSPNVEKIRWFKKNALKINKKVNH
mgnify:CR=1 FL=1